MITGKMYKGKLAYYSRWWVMPPCLTAYYLTVIGTGKRFPFMEHGMVSIIPGKLWIN